MARTPVTSDAWGDSFASILNPQKKVTASMEGFISLGSMYSQRNKGVLDLRKDHGNPEPEYEFDLRLEMQNKAVMIPTIQSITAPEDVVSFKHEFSHGGIVVPHFSDLKPISVTYWDYRALPITKRLREVYDLQFTSGYPSLEARSTGYCVIRIDTQTYLTLSEFFFSRPLKTSFTMNQQLASFKFDIVYAEYSYSDNPSDKYLDSDDKSKDKLGSIKGSITP